MNELLRANKAQHPAAPTRSTGAVLRFILITLTAFLTGLIGSAVLGVIFDMFGWTACVAGIAVSLLVAALLAVFLKTPMSRADPSEPPSPRHRPPRM
jgi:multidrug efflux pump subunit AcrB